VKIRKNQENILIIVLKYGIILKTKDKNLRYFFGETMKLLKRFLLPAVILVAFVLIFSSCAKVIENENFKTNGYILIDGEEVVPEYVIKIEDNLISFAEFRYYYLNQKYELDGGDDSVWKDYPEYVDILEENVLNTLLEVYSIRSLANDAGVEPDFEKVREEIEEYKDSMGRTEYNKGLASYYLTDELYEYILQGYDLYTTLFDYYFAEDGKSVMTDTEILEYVGANYTHAKHILIYPNTTMSDSDYEKYLDTILTEAKNTDDFDSLIAKYSDDKAMPEYGYYFTDEEMPTEFVTACDNLKEGEMSGIVKSSYGYHIILKLPVNESDVNELSDVVYNQIFTEMVNEKIESTQIEYAPEYEKITPNSIK